MMNSLQSVEVRSVLQDLFTAAAADPDDGPALPAGATAQQRAEAFQGFYLPISGRGGELLYALIRAARPRTVVEFGTSFGISTLYLAAAITDNGSGHVLTTELS